MGMRMYKEIDLGEGRVVKIFGSDLYIKTQLEMTETEYCVTFRYKGKLYDLFQFESIHSEINIQNAPDWMKEFEGHLRLNEKSGLLIKFGDSAQSVKVYTYTLETY